MGGMAKLIYSMLQSLDGHTADAAGAFGWGAPADEAVHTFVNEISAPIGTFLYGRRMYETMVFWETAHALSDEPPVIHEFARLWQSAEKLVYSSTLAAPASARTTIERSFDPEAIRRLKATSARDLAIAGPSLAAQAIRAGLVDEYQLIVSPIVVGGGTRFFPADVHLDLELVEHRSFAGGVVFLRYAVT